MIFLKPLTLSHQYCLKMIHTFLLKQKHKDSVAKNERRIEANQGVVKS